MPTKCPNELTCLFLIRFQEIQVLPIWLMDIIKFLTKLANWACPGCAQAYPGVPSGYPIGLTWLFLTQFQKSQLLSVSSLEIKIFSTNMAKWACPGRAQAMHIGRKIWLLSQFDLHFHLENSMLLQSLLEFENL